MFKEEPAMSIAKRLILMPLLVLGVAMLTTAPVEAAQPTILQIPVDDTDTFNDCGFTLVEHVEGHVTLHTFFDNNGNPRFQVDTFALQDTTTNPANGMAITFPIVGPDIITFQQNGTSTVAVIGLNGIASSSKAKAK
jgi:hypothetical protein